MHGWSSNWQIFLLNIAAFMDTHRVISLDLPGFGASELPDEPLSIRGYARLVDRVCDQLGVERVSVVGNSMGGFIGGELALSFETRVDRLVLVSAAGLSTEELPAGPLLAVARLVAAGTPAAERFRDSVVHRPRLRRAAMQWVIRYPERLSVPLSQELVLSFGKPGFVDGLRAIFDYAYRERLPEIDIPVLIVWGSNDLLVPVGDAYRYARLIGANAQGRDLRGHRARADARAPVALQRPAARLPRGRAGAGGRRRRGVYGRVTAPSDALDTSRAYFASTPWS